MNDKQKDMLAVAKLTEAIQYCVNVGMIDANEGLSFILDCAYGNKKQDRRGETSVVEHNGFGFISMTSTEKTFSDFMGDCFLSTNEDSGKPPTTIKKVDDLLQVWLYVKGFHNLLTASKYDLIMWFHDYLDKFHDRQIDHDSGIAPISLNPKAIKALKPLGGVDMLSLTFNFIDDNVIVDRDNSNIAVDRFMHGYIDWLNSAALLVDNFWTDTNSTKLLAYVENHLDLFYGINKNVTSFPIEFTHEFEMKFKPGVVVNNAGDLEQNLRNLHQDMFEPGISMLWESYVKYWRIYANVNRLCCEWDLHKVDNALKAIGYGGVETIAMDKRVTGIKLIQRSAITWVKCWISYCDDELHVGCSSYTVEQLIDLYKAYAAEYLTDSCISDQCMYIVEAIVVLKTNREPGLGDVVVHRNKQGVITSFSSLKVRS